MKQVVLVVLLVVFLFSFKNENIIKHRNISKVEIETLVEDSTLNVRALEIIKAEFTGPIYLTSKGVLGIIMPNVLYRHVDSLKNKKGRENMVNLKGTRREFMKTAGLGAAAPGITGNEALAKAKPAVVQGVVTRWRGFNPLCFFLLRYYHCGIGAGL